MRRYFNSVTLTIILDYLNERTGLYLLSTCRYLRDFRYIYYKKYDRFYPTTTLMPKSFLAHTNVGSKVLVNRLNKIVTVNKHIVNI